MKLIKCALAVAAFFVAIPTAVAQEPDQATLKGSDGTASIARALPRHRGQINAVAFSPDGQRVATAGSDGVAHVTNADTGDLIVTLSGHEDLLNTVAFTPDGLHVITGSGGPGGGRAAPDIVDKTLRVWDAASGRMVHPFKGHRQWVYGVAVAQDGRHILSAGDQVRLWRLSDAALVRTYKIGASAIAISPDGHVFATDDRVPGSRFSLREVKTGRLIRTFEGHTSVIMSVAFSPDGRHLLSGSDDGTARMWDVADSTPIQTFRGHEARIDSVAFSPDGARVLTGGRDGTVRLWDSASGTLLKTFETGSEWSIAVAYSPDGSKVAAGTDEGVLKIWDVTMRPSRHDTEPQAAHITGRSEQSGGAPSQSEQRPSGEALARLQRETNELEQLWNSERRGPDLTSKVLELAPAVERLLRSTLDSPSRDWPNANTASFFHRVLNDTSSDTERISVWRDLFLLKTVREGSIVGDFASVAWFYMLLGDARLRNPAVYETALHILDETHEVSCPPHLRPSVCELNIGGGALRAIGAPHTGLELQEAAIALLEQDRTQDFNYTAIVRLNVAVGWWQDGIAGRAAQHVAQVEALLASGQATLQPGDKAALHALQASICEAQLQFQCAERAFRAAIDEIDASTPQGNALELVYRAMGLLNDLAVRHIGSLDCTDCHQALQGVIRDYALGFVGQDNDTTPRNYSLAMMLLHTLPKGDIADQERQRLLASLGHSDRRVQRWLKRQRSPERRSMLLAVYKGFMMDERLMFASPDDSTELDRFQKFIDAKSVAVADRHVDALMEHVVRATLEFGDDRAFFSALPRMALDLRTFGAIPAERSLLRYTWRAYRTQLVDVPNPVGPARKATLAPVLAPAFARLAYLEKESGPSRGALAYANEAYSMLRHKFDREWLLGKERSVAAVRSLAPVAHSVASTLLDLAPKLNSKDAARARHRAFELAQVSSQSDTSAALQISLRRRLLDAEGQREIYEQRDQIQEDIDIAAAIAAEHGFITPIGALRRRAELETKRASLDDGRSPAGPHLYDDLTASQIVPAEEIAKLLAPGENLLIVSSGKEATILFLVSSSGGIKTHISKIGGAPLREMVREIRTGLQLQGGHYVDFPVARAYQLYRALFGPLGKDIVDANSVVSVVTGPLESLPFSVLPVRDDKVVSINIGEARSSRISWLARHTAVSRVPGVSTLAALRKANVSDREAASFLGVGDPDLGAADIVRATEFSSLERARGFVDPDWLRRQPSLPETSIELTTLSREFLRSEILTRDSAREAVLKRMELDRFDVVTFATHGVVAGTAFDNSEPGLILTSPPEASEEDDGFLTMTEIASLKFNADLVMLSACDTATSDGRPSADGLSGLVRAFYISGARNVVATHWEIPSDPAVEISTRTVQARQAEKTLRWSEALRRAQVALMDDVGLPEFAHPASWGGFQLMGAD